MHKPTIIHFTALKWVLRYLKSALFYGICLGKTKPQQLRVYTDSDWAGNPDDQMSISAYIIYFGDTPILWSSRRQWLGPQLKLSTEP